MADDIKIYYHIFVCSYESISIVDSQINALIKNKLYDECVSINVGISFTEDIFKDIILEKLYKLSKVKVRSVVKNNSEKDIKEGITLKLIFLDSKESETIYNVLYFHTKGSSKPKDEKRKSWRKYIDYIFINKWKDCVKCLNDYKIVFCFYNANYYWFKSNLSFRQDIIDFFNSKDYSIKKHRSFWEIFFGKGKDNPYNKEMYNIHNVTPYSINFLKLLKITLKI